MTTTGKFSKPSADRPAPYGVFILGMHRSGTSCLTGMLNQYGLYLGEVSEKSRFNSKGNRESMEVRSINKQLLHLNGGSWHEPVEIKKIHPILHLHIQRHRKLMEKQGRVWGVKDPRMLFCLHWWRTPADKLVGTFRHPHTVRESLEKRNREIKDPVPDDHLEDLWYRYNLRLVELYRQQPFPIIDFDWEETRYCQAVAGLARNLGLTGTTTDFFDRSLMHPPHDPEIKNPTHLTLYRQLKTIAQSEEKKLLPQKKAPQ